MDERNTNAIQSCGEIELRKASEQPKQVGVGKSTFYRGSNSVRTQKRLRFVTTLKNRVKPLGRASEARQINHRCG